MTVPSIKGSAFSSVVEDVRRLIESGRIGPELLATRLAAEDLHLLEDKILPALWYPIESYRRLSELLLEVEGGGRSEYLVARGEAAAERLFASGLYAQLRRGIEQAEQRRHTGSDFDPRDGTLMATLAGVIFNVAQWRFEDASEPGAGPVFRIEVSDAAALPEVARHAAQGFIQRAASRIAELSTGVEGVRSQVTSERPTRDSIRFTIRSPRPPRR